MNTLNVKALIMSLTLTLGTYSVCPTFMILQSKAFDAKVAALKNSNPKNHARTLAIIEVK